MEGVLFQYNFSIMVQVEQTDEHGDGVAIIMSIQ